MEKSKKQALILSIVAVVTLIALVVGATYAYFKAQTGEGSQTDIKINANTVDTFTFETGSAINLSLDQTSFASGAGNIRGSTYASAKLTANNKTNIATENYYLYLNIENNTFTYTQGETKPEILLTIKDASNNEITSISGLEYKTVTDGKGDTLKGFDITTKDGLIALLDNREITTTSSKEEKWNITIIFVNYDASQNANTGKNMTVKVMIQKETILTLAEYVISQYIDQGTNGLYYHNGTIKSSTGSIIDAEDNSYRYSGPSESVSNFICFGSDEETCPVDNLYRIIGVFENQVKLIKYEYVIGHQTGNFGDYYDDFGDYSYYKGTLESQGAFFRNNYLKPSNTFGSNTWSESNLNKIYLNTNFVKNIGEKWSKKIATTTWKVGGNADTKIAAATPKVAYQNEIVDPVSTYTTDGKTDYSAKVGLMYVSDYMYSASVGYWDKVGYDELEGNDYRKIVTSNWMYMGLYEWTITRASLGSSYSHCISNVGSVSSKDGKSEFPIRPVFYLTPSVTYLSGDGTQNSPIRIN